MTFTLTDYTQALKYAKNPMQDAVANFMNSYQHGVQARYAQPMAEAGYQTAHANAIKAKATADLISSFVNGMNGQGQGQGQGMPNTGGNPTPTPPPQQMNGSPIPNQGQPNNNVHPITQAINSPTGQPQPPLQPQNNAMQQSNPNGMGGSSSPHMDYAKAAFISKALGMPEPKIMEIPGTGQIIAVTPFGNIPVAQGNSALAQNLAKVNAQKYGELGDTALSARTAQAGIDQMNHIINSPEFAQLKQVPLMGDKELRVLKYTGTPDQQKMIGAFDVLSGKSITDRVGMFKGMFRKGEQQLLEKMVVTGDDTLNSAIGKAKTFSLLNQILMQRVDMTANLVANGVPYIQALQQTDKALNIEAIDKQIENDLEKAKDDEMITVVSPDGKQELKMKRSEARLKKVPNV